MAPFNRIPRLPFKCVLLGAALIALIALLGWTPATPHAQSGGSVVWDRYDITIDVQDDGVIQVTERMEVTFSGSHEYTFGYAEIPLDRADEITNVAIQMGPGRGDGVTLSTARQVPAIEFQREPGTYKAVDTGATMDIQYGFEPLSTGSITVELTYEAHGALRVYTDETPPNQQVYWTAISDEVAANAPIRAASVTIHLPKAVALADVVLGEDTPGPAKEHTTDGQTWRWEAAGLDEGDELVARMQFPPITSATEPAWQDRDDAERQEEEDAERRETILGMAALSIGGLGLSGGGIWLYRKWYATGRDPHVGLVAEYLTEPPDNRPPALAGALVDEVARTPELVATMLDLARRGFLVIEQTGEKEFAVIAGEIGATNGLRPYEQMLLDALFPVPTPGTMVDLADVRTRLTAATKRIKAEIYDELVDRGDMVENPEAVRQRWTVAGSICVAAAAAVGFLFRGALGWPAFVLVGILGLAGAALLLTAKAMPRRTEQGAVAVAKWRAFHRHLREIERFGADSPLARDPDLFERYLPFATVFGVEKSWVETFARAGAPAPRWYDPPRGQVWWGRPMGGGAGFRGSRGRDGDGWDGPSIPSPQGMSDSAMRSLASVNAGILGFFNSAATAFTPPSSKGGSGGGFSGGGGGGGSGGGGSRGFG